MAAAPPSAFVLTTLVLCVGTAWAFALVQRQALKFLLIAGLAVAYYGLVVHAFTGHGVWMELVFPEGTLALTYAVSATVEYLTEGRQRRVLRAVFDKYMAAEVVDEIMRNPASIKLGGEKKELTVFFSDVAGFTTISEKLDPEDLVFLLNEYLSSMTDIILRNRGNVNKYFGDGIMALFGAPRGEPDHASRACVAALENQEALAQLRKEWAARGYPEIVARIGINSGPLVVGNMGSQARMEYTVMGDSVNLASRLEGANKFYDTLILLGPRTYELAQPDIEAREVDMLRVKGKLEPVRVEELVARTGTLSAAKQRVVGLYQDGLAANKRREFVRAKEHFEAALALDPSDGPSKVYLHRVQEYLATPPPPDWDGVYVLQSKWPTVEVPLKRPSRLAAPLITLLLLSLYLLTVVALAETVFVQSKTAKLRSGKTSLDSVVADLKFGEPLEVLGKEGNWLAVQTARGAKGWIFAGKTTPTKPASSENDVLAKLGKSFRRTEAGDVTASAGARGLDKVSEGYANRVGITQQHRDAIDRMAGYRITDQEVEDFLKSGGLGEYAK